METSTSTGSGEKVTFYYDLDHCGDNPIIESTSQLVPDWYKKIPLVFKSVDGGEMPSVKHCLPFIEALTIGYLLLTPEEYIVTKENGVLRMSSASEVMGERQANDVGMMPAPHGYSPVSFSWDNRLSLEIPEGYSCLFTQPLNRFDVPFITLSAVMDGYYKMPTGKIAFYLRNDFEGVIPAGTPFVQIIPFKREDYSLEYRPGLLLATREGYSEMNSNAQGYDEEWRNQKNTYRKNSYSKKFYRLVRGNK